MTNMKTKILTEANFDDTIQGTDVPVLIDFHAPWCAPCQMLGPIIDEIAEAQEGNAIVAKVNVDEEPELTARYSIQSLPTFIVFQGSEQVARSQGMQSKAAIEELLVAQRAV